MTDCIVLGAGIVGVSTALALQERGRQVVLLDRKAPGQETSYGNAGIIQTESVEPHAFPRNMRQILSLALKRGNDVDWRWRDVPHFAKPLYHYFRASAPQHYAQIIAAYSGLILRASDDHARFIDAAGAGDLIAKQGWQIVYRSEEKWDIAARNAERLQQTYGVPSRIISGDDLAKSETDLTRKLAGAVHWTSPWTCNAPGELVTRYAELFIRRGGQIVTGDAATLRQDGDNWRVSADDGVITAQNAVIALGAWSPAVLKRFGYRIPMVFKRGYHRHVTTHTGPRLATLDAETATFMAPMRVGLRILTGAHLAPVEARPASCQMSRSMRSAGELFKLGATIDEVPWMGTRPCMPDMLPVVGASGRHSGLWFNFGHGHQGFTLAATTGLLLAEQMCEKHINPLVQPLSPALRY